MFDHIGGRVLRAIIGGMVLGAIVVGGISFAVGIALGPGPETGAMYGINQLASGVAWGAWGALAGAILGGVSGWVLKKATSP